MARLAGLHPLVVDDGVVGAGEDLRLLGFVALDAVRLTDVGPVAGVGRGLVLGLGSESEGEERDGEDVDEAAAGDASCWGRGIRSGHEERLSEASCSPARACVYNPQPSCRLHGSISCTATAAR